MIETVTALTEQAAMATSRACALVGVPRSTYYRLHRGYRHYQPVAAPIPHTDRVQPAALTPAERDQIITVLTDADIDDEQAEVGEDLSVQQIYWRAFDAGVIGCSQRTFYRVAASQHLVGDRRRGGHGRRGSHGRKPPAVAATRPNQLWSWDATELTGPRRERYKLMLAIDVYSRFPIGWKIEREEAIPHAIDLFAAAIHRYGVPEVIHADNGSVMRSNDLVHHLYAHHILTSYSRPRVSDDNPFSESMFKTIKYDLSCPDRFDSIDHARAWTHTFLTHYATHHRHSGLAHYTPAAVYHGTVDADQARRQAHLDQYWQSHPERFHRPPKAPTITTTGINTHLLSQQG
jgi:putative transposase